MSTAIRESALQTIARGHIGYKELIRQVGAAKPELDAVLTGLRRDGLIETTLKGYRLAPKRVDWDGVDLREPQQQPVAAAPPPRAATEPPKPQPVEPPMRQDESFVCNKCGAAKPAGLMSQRNGKVMSRCRACWSAGLSKGHRKQPPKDEVRALAKIVRKHTRPKSTGPLQLRKSREIRAERDELEVHITIHENDQAAGSVTLTYSEAAGLRDWLNAQHLE